MMEENPQEIELKERILTLETQLKHLRNDLRLTKEENEVATTNYFEMVSKLESMVADRTRDVERLRKILEQKALELEIMLDSTPAIVFYKDAEQRLIRANRNFARPWESRPMSWRAGSSPIFSPNTPPRAWRGTGGWWSSASPC